MGSIFKNAEGYFDPTVGKALSNIARTERRNAARTYRPLVYICSRYSGDVVHNVAETQKFCSFAVKKNTIPVAPHLLYPQFLDDNDPKERELSLFFGKVLLTKCSEMWVFTDGELSTGMRLERTYAQHRGIKIRYFTTSCREAPLSGAWR